MTSNIRILKCIPESKTFLFSCVVVMMMFKDPALISSITWYREMAVFYGCLYSVNN